MWDTILLASSVLLWLVVLFLGFMLLGTLRVIGLLKWRLVQLESTTPSRMNRNGLKPGKKAPDFTLPDVNGVETSLHDFTRRKILLVFTQSGCEPCHAIMPELAAVNSGDVQILVVNKGDIEATRAWATELGVRFPVLVQDGLEVSRKYEAFATPFAFLVDETGVVASSGIVLAKEHLGYVLSGAGQRLSERHANEEGLSTEREVVSDSISTKEIQHV